MSTIAHIPTNVVTGLLGVGKTTALLDLLARKPDGGRWAVLVNEFGEVPIDQAAFEGREIEGIHVKEVAGGCLCCTAGVPLQVAVALLLREANPDRLLIEMSGLGHPGFVIRSLRESRIREAIELRATICLVDPRDVEEPEIRGAQTFLDQVHVADVLVANKSDLCEPDQLRLFDDWARALFPAKRIVHATSGGRVDPAWLDLDPGPLRAPLFADPGHHHGHDHDEEDPTRGEEMSSAGGAEEPLLPGKPFRAMSEGLGHAGCGWIFSPEDRFEQDALLELLAESDRIRRIKGVFRIAGEWIHVNRTGREICVSPTAYCRDSRLEVIAESPLDWDLYERELRACLKPARDPVPSSGAST